MADFQLKLTPDMVNPGTEGSMDTAVVDGVSLQRTANCFDVINGDNRKHMALADGEEFDDTVATWSDDSHVVSL